MRRIRYSALYRVNFVQTYICLDYECCKNATASSLGTWHFILCHWLLKRGTVFLIKFFTISICTKRFLADYLWLCSTLVSLVDCKNCNAPYFTVEIVSCPLVKNLLPATLTLYTLHSSNQTNLFYEKCDVNYAQCQYVTNAYKRGLHFVWAAQTVLQPKKNTFLSIGTTSINRYKVVSKCQYSCAVFLPCFQSYTYCIRCERMYVCCDFSDYLFVFLKASY